MRKLYPLDAYIRAVEELARRHGLSVRPYQGKKNAVGFRVFKSNNSEIPIEVWTIHTEHGRGKSRLVWSRGDMKKPALNIMGATQEEFEEILDSL